MITSLRKMCLVSSVIWVFMGHSALGVETTAFDGSKTNFGTTIDWKDDLDGETTDSMIRGGLQWRIAANHAIMFSYYRMDFKGNGGLDQNFQIDDTIFQVGAKTKSELDLALYRFLYSYSFYRSEKAELSLSPGFYLQI